MISDRKLFLDREGNVVEDGDPAAFELLVGEGCELADSEAERLGVKPKARAKAKADADAGDKPEAESKLVHADRKHPAKK